MNKVEMLEQMFEMQAKLNSLVERRNDISLRDVVIHGDLELAIIDEVGELNHELKAIWCWWKKSVAPVDYGKVLEELVDIWHFVMTKYLVSGTINTARKEFIQAMEYDGGLRLYSQIIKDFVQYQTMDQLVEVTKILGFSFEEIYQVYMKKNQVNVERQEGDY